LSHATKYGAGSCGEHGDGWCNYIYENPNPDKEIIRIGGYKDSWSRAMKNGG